MSIRFAAARHFARSPVARALTRPEIAHVANDDGEAGAAETQLLHDTLRHFAVYGMGAAQVAADEARSALGAGDAVGGERWLAICRTLDRRMADGVAGADANSRPYAQKYPAR